MSYISYICTIYIYIYIYMVLLKGIPLALTRRNKGSSVNFYEGGEDTNLLNKSSSNTCILFFTFLVGRHSI